MGEGSFLGSMITEYKVVGKDKWGKQMCQYTCNKCGNVFTSHISAIRKNKTGMCSQCAHTKHGLTKHPLYGVWANMKQRCKDKGHHAYKNYGARGINVCDEWLNSFQAFYDWAMTNGYKKGLSIDRIDNDGDYCPENCRWATVLKQNLNQRVRCDNTSGIVGVYRKRLGGSWGWQITIKGKIISKHGFPSKEAALNARNKFIEDNNLPHKIQTLTNHNNE